MLMLENLVFTLAAGIVILLIILEFTIISQRTERMNANKPKTSGLDTAKEGKPEEKCCHFLGYLATYPRSQPVPDECFGCEKAAECIDTNSTRAKDRKPVDIIEAEQPQQYLGMCQISEAKCYLLLLGVRDLIFW